MHRRLVLLVSVIALVLGGEADALVVLTMGKVAIFRDRPGTARDSGLIRFGRDRALATLHHPTCPADPVTVQLASYPQATNLLEAGEAVELPCEGWIRQGRGFQYRDASGAHGGIRRVVYAPDQLLIKWGGEGFVPLAGPVGYMEVWFTAGGTRHLGRFQNFRRNEQTAVISRKASTAAARGEAAFWDVLLGDDPSESRQRVALHCLELALSRSRQDGRSRFLLGMMHLYRYGQATLDPHDVSPAARDEIVAADAAFAEAVPLLWDGAHGDTRVPGFAGAAKYQLGFVLQDAALMAEAIADLDAAYALNPIFNVFDYIPVAQVVPRTDPSFITVVDALDEVLGGPAVTCVDNQPEICGDRGLAPSNTSGSLILFGDLYAKAGRLADAEQWYRLAQALAQRRPTPYRFQAVADERVATAAARVALYDDGDLGNDPPLIGVGEEACASCHNR